MLEEEFGRGADFKRVLVRRQALCPISVPCASFRKKYIYNNAASVISRRSIPACSTLKLSVSVVAAVIFVAAGSTADEQTAYEETADEQTGTAAFATQSPAWTCWLCECNNPSNFPVFFISRSQRGHVCGGLRW